MPVKQSEKKARGGFERPKRCRRKKMSGRRGERKLGDGNAQAKSDYGSTLISLSEEVEKHGPFLASNTLHSQHPLIVEASRSGHPLDRMFVNFFQRCNSIVFQFKPRLLHLSIMEAALKTFFSTPNFAVVGASSDPSKFGHKSQLVLAMCL
jgi:hypothetical protein